MGATVLLFRPTTVLICNQLEQYGPKTPVCIWEGGVTSNEDGTAVLNEYPVLNDQTCGANGIWPNHWWNAYDSITGKLCILRLAAPWLGSHEGGDKTGI